MLQFSNSSKSTQIMININSNSSNTDASTKLEAELSKLVDDTLKDAYQQISRINKEVLYHPIFDDTVRKIERTKYLTAEQLNQKGINIPSHCPKCHTKLKFFEKKYPKKEENFSKHNCFIKCLNCGYTCSDYFWKDTAIKFHKQIKETLLKSNKSFSKWLIIIGVLMHLLFDWSILAFICIMLGIFKWFFDDKLVNVYMNKEYSSIPPEIEKVNKEELSICEEYTTLVNEIAQKISMQDSKLQTDVNELMNILTKIKKFIDEHEAYSNQLNYIINSTKLVNRLVDIKINMYQYEQELQKNNDELNVAIKKLIQVHEQFYQRLVNSLMDEYSVTIKVASQMADESIRQ